MFPYGWDDRYLSACPSLVKIVFLELLAEIDLESVASQFLLHL
jgi:hypothetical protein